jgi:hypothetical protein
MNQCLSLSKQFIEINARIQGQTDIEQTPKYEKPNPTREEVESIRQEWFAHYPSREP